MHKRWEHGVAPNPGKSWISRYQSIRQGSGLRIAHRVYRYSSLLVDSNKPFVFEDDFQGDIKVGHNPEVRLLRNVAGLDNVALRNLVRFWSLPAVHLYPTGTYQFDSQCATDARCQTDYKQVQAFSGILTIRFPFGSINHVTLTGN